MKVHQSSTSKKYLRSKEVRVARKEKRTLRKKAIVVFEARFGKNYTSKFQSKLKIIMAEFSNN